MPKFIVTFTIRAIRMRRRGRYQHGDPKWRKWDREVLVQAVEELSAITSAMAQLGARRQKKVVGVKVRSGG